MPYSTVTPVDEAPSAPAVSAAAAGRGPAEEAEALVEDEMLVEEISIDGMCGVY